MITFAEFQELVNLSMEALCRDFFRENPDRVRVKKEATVVRNLVKILDATLMISNQKGSRADLSRETGLSMGRSTPISAAGGTARHHPGAGYGSSCGS